MKTLLFDVDDTLLDFKLAEKKALHALFEEENVPFTSEVESTYHRINQGLWRSFEEGKITKDVLLDTRFGLLFDAFNREVDSVKMGENYREYLSQGHDLLGNSQRILEKLAPHYDLYIVTNGVAKTQYRRLEDSKLMPYFKDIFVSEEVGYQKPMKEYFDFVFERIPNFSREKNNDYWRFFAFRYSRRPTSENSNCLAQSDLRSSNTNHSTQLYDSTAR
ncbi:noncanonical pyrimidine nucleotidase, YjjG family protein [Enterococcus faecalis]|nr:noncanonical pyrimidine nucleotidase, YjjG family protein [Enterococcus faecalis]